MYSIWDAHGSRKKNLQTVISGIFGERNFVIGTPFITGTATNRGFSGSDCLVSLVVLVARDGPSEFYNWHPIYNCQLHIRQLGPQVL